MKKLKSKLKKLLARTHPVYGNASPEEVALKLGRRDRVKTVKKEA